MTEWLQQIDGRVDRDCERTRRRRRRRRRPRRGHAGRRPRRRPTTPEPTATPTPTETPAPTRRRADRAADRRRGRRSRARGGRGVSRDETLFADRYQLGAASASAAWRPCSSRSTRGSSATSRSSCSPSTWPRTRVRLALPPRGAGRRAARAPEHRPGLRLRARRGDAPQLHRDGVRRRPVVRGDPARARHAAARRGARHPRPVLPRARLRAPPRRRAPRRQARQPAAQPRPAWSSWPTSASPRRPSSRTSRRSAPCSAPPPTSRRSRPAASPPARASDLYALGVVAYQLMAGRLPYDAASLTDLARLQETGPPPRLDDLEPDVPPALAMAVARALHRDPEHRYADAAEMEEALRDGLSGRAPAGGTDATWALPRTRRRPRACSPARARPRRCRARRSAAGSSRWTSPRRPRRARRDATRAAAAARAQRSARRRCSRPADRVLALVAAGSPPTRRSTPAAEPSAREDVRGSGGRGQRPPRVIEADTPCGRRARGERLRAAPAEGGPTPPRDDRTPARRSRRTQRAGAPLAAGSGTRRTRSHAHTARSRRRRRSAAHGALRRDGGRRLGRPASIASRRAAIRRCT